MILILPDFLIRLHPAMLPYRIDTKLTDVLSSSSAVSNASKGQFTLSAEVMPPRNGSEQRVVMDQIGSLIGAGAEFLSVTKGAGGSLRGGSLPIAQAIKERFSKPCIAHFTCRDLTAAEVENLLMDHHYFGIRNILALRGDPPDGQPQWSARDGGHQYAYQLIEQIRALNQGRYLARKGGPEAQGEAEQTDFCIGAAVYPDHPDPQERVEFFRRKVDAGAEYGITDMLFNPEVYARFLDLCGKQGLTQIPILPGTRILKTQAQAERMATKFKVSLPPYLLAKLAEKDGPDALSRGIDLFVELVQKLKAYGAPGVHLFVIVDQIAATAALAQLRSMGYGDTVSE